jgi:ABC-type antimicrobial peptide transport system permease subunit
MREAATLLAIGLAAGVGLALSTVHAAASMLFGLKPYDSGVLGIAVVLLASVTAAASYLPARRAAALEPTVALREE